MGVLVLTATIASCAGEGGGNGAGQPVLSLRLIGTVGDLYRTLAVSFDRGAIGWPIDGDTCEGSSELQGCRFSAVEELAAEADSVLTFTISDCEAPFEAFTVVASCLGDERPREVFVTSTATCSVATPGCDTTPDICFTTRHDAVGCPFDGTTTSSTSSTSTLGTTSTTVSVGATDASHVVAARALDLR